MLRLPTASKTLLNKNFAKFVSRRGYAEDVAANTVLKLKFALPHETIYDNTKVTQVNLPVQSGHIGVLANHVPIAEQLKPGVIEIFEESLTSTPKKYFVSGGFATVQPDSTLCITSVEAFSLDSFSKENISSLLSEANKNKSSSDANIATEASIQAEVLESLQAALK